MSTAIRRYDIDWLRVIAIGLLLLYHAAIGFQAWGIMLGFITTDQPWDALWTPMTMLNVWRIPLLFFVSGMGVYFAIQNRNWKQLLKERALRIFIPFVFGIVVIVPVHVFLWQYYYQMPLQYQPNPAHLWFLGNIFVYVILLLPIFFYFKSNETGKIVSMIKNILASPFGLMLVIAAFIAEVLILNPNPYELYAMTAHGFFLGLLAFFFGFCFVLSGSAFWKMLLKWKWLFVIAALSLYSWRSIASPLPASNMRLVIETNCWIFSIFAFGHQYLNRSGKALQYLSQAAYPVYIIHMVFLFLASTLIFPLEINLQSKFVLVLGLTLCGCFVFYEFIIRRVNFIRPLFGLKLKKRVIVKSFFDARLPEQCGGKNRIIDTVSYFRQRLPEIRATFASFAWNDLFFSRKDRKRFFRPPAGWAGKGREECLNFELSSRCLNELVGKIE